MFQVIVEYFWYKQEQRISSLQQQYRRDADSHGCPRTRTRNQSAGDSTRRRRNVDALTNGNRYTPAAADTNTPNADRRRLSNRRGARRGIPSPPSAARHRASYMLYTTDPPDRSVNRCDPSLTPIETTATQYRSIDLTGGSTSRAGSLSGPPGFAPRETESLSSSSCV
ncbi:hypothetical protein SEVIR_2G338250v4 [Setaria viridis]